MFRPARHYSFRLLGFVAGWLCALSPAFSQDPDPSPEAEQRGISSIESLNTDPVDEPAPFSTPSDLSSLRQEMATLQEQVNTIVAGQDSLELRQKKILSELRSPPELTPPPKVDLAPLQAELEQLSELVSSMEPITAADEVVFETPPDPYTDKIFILIILVLALLAILILLQLFLKGKATGGTRVSGLGKKDLEGLLQAINQVSDQTKALQATLEKNSASSSSPDIRESIDAAIAPLLRTLEENASEEALQNKLETFQDTLVSQDQRLSLIQDGFQRLEKTAETAADNDQQVRELEQEIARLKEELETTHQSLSGEKTKLESQSAGLEDSLQKTAALFPEWIRGDGPLEGITKILTNQIADSQSATARSFLGHALQLDGALTSGDTSRKELASHLAHSSQAAYHMLLRDLNLDKDQVRKSMRTWIANLDKTLSAQSAHLRLSQVFPGDSFQLATMEAVDSISGNRLTVDQPLSWLIEDTSESPPRVLQRAKVVTA